MIARLPENMNDHSTWINGNYEDRRSILSGLEQVLNPKYIPEKCVRE